MSIVRRTAREPGSATCSRVLELCTTVSPNLSMNLNIRTTTHRPSRRAPRCTAPGCSGHCDHSATAARLHVRRTASLGFRTTASPNQISLFSTYSTTVIASTNARGLVKHSVCVHFAMCSFPMLTAAFCLLRRTVPVFCKRLATPTCQPLPPRLQQPALARAWRPSLSI